MCIWRSCGAGLFGRRSRLFETTRRGALTPVARSIEASSRGCRCRGRGRKRRWFGRALGSRAAARTRRRAWPPLAGPLGAAGGCRGPGGRSVRRRAGAGGAAVCARRSRVRRSGRRTVSSRAGLGRSARAEAGSGCARGPWWAGWACRGPWGGDAVPDTGATAVAELKRGDVLALLVGPRARVAVAVLVEDRESRALRPLAPADQPGPLGRQLRDPGAVPDLPIAVDCLHPQRFGRVEDRMPNGRGQLGADRAADPGAAAVGGASVRRATDIATHQDLRIKVLGPEPVEREPEHLEVLLRGVRAGAPGPQDRGERLTGLIQVAADRVKPVAVLVVAGPRSSSSAPSRASRATFGVVDSGRAPAVQTRARAAARAVRMRSSYGSRSTSARGASWFPTRAHRTGAPAPHTPPCRSRSRRRRPASPPRPRALAPDRAPSDAPASQPTPPTAPRSARPRRPTPPAAPRRVRHQPIAVRRDLRPFQDEPSGSPTECPPGSPVKTSALPILTRPARTPPRPSATPPSADRG